MTSLTRLFSRKTPPVDSPHRESRQPRPAPLLHTPLPVESKGPWTYYTPLSTWVAIAAFTVLGSGMVLQPERFSRTPAYANLISIFRAEAWGLLYIGAAVLMLVWMLLPIRLMGVLAHTVASLLVLVWLVGFVIRYISDSHTTIVNCVSWSLLLLVVTRSSVGLDEEPRAKR